MKRCFLLLGFLIAILSTSSALSTTYSNYFPNLKQQEKSTAEKSAYLQKLHKEIFSLPYEREFITEKIMAEVILKRTEVAPHYPSRNQTGDDATKVNAAFDRWIQSYPMEYNSYIDQISIILRKYKTASR